MFLCNLLLRRVVDDAAA